MPWALILQVIAALLPLLLEWLTGPGGRLEKAAGKLGIPAGPATGADDLARVFDQAERDLTWWDVLRGRRRQLRAARRATLKRAPEIVGAAYGAGSVVPPLTDAETRELGG